MFRSLKTHATRVGFGACVALAATGAAAQQAQYAGIGRPATPAEIKAWDIDVRPDFLGLPPGKGSVAQGTDVWEARCASCHGTFAESNEVFTPIVGGVTAEDIKRGHVANLLPGKEFPQRTTFMKVATLSTVWDYINRAMPWNNPKTLKTDEVYAVVAYLLNLANVVPDDFVLSDKNIAEIQNRMPNRLGMTRQHGMWDVAGKPDVQGSPCMRNCETEPRVSSVLPDYARNAHGNLQEQNRIIGPTRGADTTKPAAQVRDGLATVALSQTAGGGGPKALAEKNACLACHAVGSKLVGPSYKDVAQKYAQRPDAEAYLIASIKKGGSGLWGQAVMPPQEHVPDAEIQALAKWILGGAK